MNQEINLDDYTYNLPEEKIAKFPLADRSSSKLLVYKNRQIIHKIFSGIIEDIPKDSLLVFNNTRVIPARFNFKKETGAVIEILLLDPVTPSRVISEAMETKGECVWHCMIGNLKRWRAGSIVKSIHIDGEEIVFNAELIDSGKQLIRFTWNEYNRSFLDIINWAGQMPLPPYLKREVIEEDYRTYQTVYSKYEGAVAAPTAGLHFTHQIIDDLKADGHLLDFLTLHVGAGTFQPIKTKKIDDHEMHKEQIILTKQNITKLISHKGSVVAIGTTSMRTLESIYWIGLNLLENPNSDFSIKQSDPNRYTKYNLPSKKDALQAVLNRMNKDQMDTIISDTAIFIYPGYQFKMCDALITNFHQPGSTLILLVAAFIGNDWFKVYQEALKNDYRFLSYGDSSLLVP
ncbi:MAG: S-adenosylmethionine:tRNA ribosyltransferase-isomerase [Bacteroidetes bacterium]|nr:S-adenosylmethionine:tRNA ribosyltransferase-isomerase [Bacteroidota bacterium]MDA1119953.1 S-adenosylmethionine:tRNA ribosyltransferase-isomerase [Bacteroidota bacterium]